MSYTRQLVVDDKPLGRPLAKDRQEILRFIKAYEKREGRVPERIAIQRYNPATGEPVHTELHKPETFLPQPSSEAAPAEVATPPPGAGNDD